ncbi:AI-2E family transporter [Leifsonia sp. H3M29-4]|uniref:AI-2E family transporter n=1 Tax=Salinibacterium metalliresistens TaxID=3031321 RepID=UPI0023DCCCF1|nr:AI-2E family transporter [Salinibacterium metalliresistens]MDF1479459.1 AI-2E family transporter [Salinibacterium metalliresistens]
MALSRSKKLEPAPVDVEQTVPVGLKIAAAYSWRILLVLGVLAVFIYVFIQFRYIAIPFMISVLIGALLVPFVQWLQRHRWPKWLAVTMAMVGTIAIVTGLIIVVVAQIRSGYPDLQDRSLAAFQDFRDWLVTSPFAIDDTEFDAWIASLVEAVQRDSQALINGALSVGSTAGHVLAGLLLTLFATLFILIDGKGIWAWIVRLFPKRARPAVDGSGRAGWVTLTTFVKVQIFVAAVDAIGIGLGAWILGLVFGGFPLVIPIAIAVFLGSFIPVVGAVVTGAIAAFVALVYLGPLPALIMLGIVLLVQQVEGHVLQPLVMGTAVKVHPLAVVFAVAAGSYIGGIAGALFAVPVVAVANVMVHTISSGSWRTNPNPTAKEIFPSA